MIEWIVGLGLALLIGVPLLVWLTKQDWYQDGRFPWEK